MEGDIDLHTVALTTLTFEARNLLSCLLNTTKILLSEGPDKLPRDWRGLASLINISSEIAGSYETKDKTAKVIEYWIQKKDGTATVGKLLEYVQRIDRYDIFDDFIDLSSRGKLVINQYHPKRNGFATPKQACMEVARLGGNQLVPYEEDDEENIITFDDKIHGSPQFYHAYILYAREDRDFVDEIILRMRDKGYKMCTEDDLLADHTTTFAPVSRLISSERCYRIILVYSPDFLTSPANNFYMDYAQAVGIEMKRPKIIPCMYRQCVLPPQVTFYHKLYYNQPGARISYNFWEKLSSSLRVSSPSPLKINDGMSTSSYSAMNITEMLPSNQTLSSDEMPQSRSGLLALPPIPAKSHSMNGIDRLTVDSDTLSLSGTSQSSEGKSAKKGRIRRMFNQLNKTLKLPKKME